MSYTETKVIEMDKGKRVGDPLIQGAYSVPYNNDNSVGDELDKINQDLANCHINILLNSSYTTSDLVTSIVRATGQQYFKDGKTLIVSVNIVISGLTGTRRAVCELYCEKITSNTKIIQGSIFYDGYVYSVKGTTQDDWSTVSVSFNSRIDALDSNKQNKTDNSLETTSKTVVGAINEINSNLTKSTITFSMGTGWTVNSNDSYVENGIAHISTTFVKTGAIGTPSETIGYVSVHPTSVPLLTATILDGNLSGVGSIGVGIRNSDGLITVYNQSTSARIVCVSGCYAI